jgi:CRISPR-associated protein Csm1
VYARRQCDLAGGDPESCAIANFEELAQQSTGKALIGVLRMDVDNLGTIFMRGIDEKKRTFARLASVSRQFSIFFKSYLDVLLAGTNVPKHITLTDFSGKDPKQNGRNAAVVYSGGDDLFLVGAWDEIAEISIDIQKALQAFSGYNQDVTLSGGFIFQHHNFPLYIMAKLAHDAEYAAKTMEGKNSLALFYVPELEELQHGRINKLTQTIPWHKMDEIVIGPLRKFLSFGVISGNSGHRYFKFNDMNKSDLGRLYQIMRKWEREGVMYLPAMAYILGRAKEGFKNSDLATKLMDKDYVANLRNSILWITLLSRSNS